MRTDHLRHFLELSMESIERLSDELGYPITKEDYYVEHLGCPHKQPSNLPKGYAAVYIFIYVEEKGDAITSQFLKIGKANAKSNARFVSQHYGFNAKSTLARSLCEDPDFRGVNVENVKKWMLNNLCRINILIKEECGKAATELIESVLHYQYRPKYEGNI